MQWSGERVTLASIERCVCITRTPFVWIGVVIIEIIRSRDVKKVFKDGLAMFQSMGINSPRYNGVRRAFAAGFVIVTIGMNCAFVVAIQLGVVAN